MQERTDSARRDWPWLLTLFVIVLALRLWHIAHTEVMARDSVFFIRIAREFESKTYVEVVRTHYHHPGYAFLIKQASMPVRWILGRVDPMVMQYSAQTVTLLAALALIWPAYYMGKLLRNRWVGAGAILYFQFLPVPGQCLSDGISDGVFLFWAASALCFALYGFEVGRWYDFPLAGLCGGLAYWTRPEGVIALLAILVCLAGFQSIAPWRHSWRRWGGEMAGFAGCALLAGSLYFIASGTFTLKPSGNQTLHDNFNLPVETKRDLEASRTTQPLWAMTFQPGWIKAVMALAYEFGKGYHIVGVIPVLVGVFAWRWPRSLRGSLLLLTYFCGQSAALLLLGRTVGYISERHVMVLLYLASFAAALGIEVLARGALAWRARGGAVNERAVLACSMLFVGGLIAAALPRTLKPLNDARHGNYVAGLWLGKHVQPGDEVFDNYNWSRYYAGCDFLPSDAPATGVRYVVASRAKDIPGEAAGQTPVYVWPENAPIEKAKVTIWKFTPHRAQPPAEVPAQPVGRPKDASSSEKGRT